MEAVTGLLEYGQLGFAIAIVVIFLILIKYMIDSFTKRMKERDADIQKSNKKRDAMLQQTHKDCEDRISMLTNKCFDLIDKYNECLNHNSEAMRSLIDTINKNK